MAGNETPIHGKKCRIDKGGVLIDFSVDWSINVSVDMADASKQGADWKNSLAGQAGATGSMNFHFVAGNPEQKALMDNIICATPGTLLTDVKFMLEDSGDYFSGNVFLNGFAVPTSVGDTVNCSFDVTIDGELSLTLAA